MKSSIGIFVSVTCLVFSAFFGLSMLLVFIGSFIVWQLPTFQEPGFQQYIRALLTFSAFVGASIMIVTWSKEE